MSNQQNDIFLEMVSDSVKAAYENDEFIDWLPEQFLREDMVFDFKIGKFFPVNEQHYFNELCDYIVDQLMNSESPISELSLEEVKDYARELWNI